MLRRQANVTERSGERGLDADGATRQEQHGVLAHAGLVPVLRLRRILNVPLSGPSGRPANVSGPTDIPHSFGQQPSGCGSRVPSQ
jgi:hypothetical protein